MCRDKTVHIKLERFAGILLLLFFLSGIQTDSLYASGTADDNFVSERYPVDVSFMIADLKYSKERGVKICEIQHGILSVFYGDRFIHGEPGIIPVNFFNNISQYYDKSWALADQFAEGKIRKMLSDSPEWITYSKLSEVEKDPDFIHRASLPVHDPYSIHSYHGFVAVKGALIKNHDVFKQKYPGVILIDAATHSYWIDKYKVSKLFAKDERTASFKPKWNLYTKKYTKKLADLIQNDLECEKFVIKPRGAFHGCGVIIVDRENLDKVLKYILKKTYYLSMDPDPSYRYWVYDDFDTFLVEEFVESDPVAVSHLDNKVFQPTMRVAFLLINDNQEIHVEFLGSYCQLPGKSLSEKGTLNQKHKSICDAPYYCDIPPGSYKDIEEQLSEVLPLIYKQMLMGK